MICWMLWNVVEWEEGEHCMISVHWYPSHHHHHHSQWACWHHQCCCCHVLLLLHLQDPLLPLTHIKVLFFPKKHLFAKGRSQKVRKPTGDLFTKSAKKIYFLRPSLSSYNFLNSEEEALRRSIFYFRCSGKVQQMAQETWSGSSETEQQIPEERSECHQSGHICTSQVLTQDSDI